MSYDYRESRVFISKEEILAKVTQEQVFQMVFEATPREYNYLFSPFRKDTTPECYFEWYKDTLWFIDWAEPFHKKRHRDCFNAVQDWYGVSFYKSLEIVNEHFKLNLLAGHHDDSGYVKETKKNIIKQKKKKKDIHAMDFKARMFDGEVDRLFWQPFQITRDNLIEDNVFPIIWYKIYSKRLRDFVVIRPQTRCYMVGNFGERRKFYTPDKVGVGKWATNCNANDIWGINDLDPTGDKLIITKSYKDWRVLKNQGIKNVIAFQNEGMYPSENLLEPLLLRFKEVIVFFDNDRAGIEAAESLVDHINQMFPNKSSYVYLKESLMRYQISDPSDLIHKKGKKPLTEFLLQNKLIN